MWENDYIIIPAECSIVVVVFAICPLSMPLDILSFIPSFLSAYLFTIALYLHSPYRPTDIYELIQGRPAGTSFGGHGAFAP